MDQDSPADPRGIVLEVERKGSVVAWARHNGWIGQTLKLVEPWMLEEADRRAEQSADYVIITQQMETALRSHGLSQVETDKMTPSRAHAILRGLPNDTNKSYGPLALCEGYATGSSVHEATPASPSCAL